MEITKFEDIIKNNNVNKEEAMACTDKFYGLLGMEPGSEIMNLPQVVGSLFSNKKFLAIQMPLKDKCALF